MFLEVPPSPGRDEQLRTTWRRVVRLLSWLGFVALTLFSVAVVSTLLEAISKFLENWP